MNSDTFTLIIDNEFEYEFSREKAELLYLELFNYLSDGIPSRDHSMLLKNLTKNAAVQIGAPIYVF